jgi:hypothetical protein
MIWEFAWRKPRKPTDRKSDLGDLKAGPSEYD